MPDETSADASPDFVAQNGEILTGGEAFRWFQARAAGFSEKGATWLRMTVDDADNPTLRLIEGWLIRPHPEPPAHFLLQLAADERADAP